MNTMNREILECMAYRRPVTMLDTRESHCFDREEDQWLATYAGLLLLSMQRWEGRHG